MFVRVALIATLCASLTACAQSPILAAPDLTTGSLQAVPTVSTAEMQNLGRQTFAGKVLAAIALERITGLKPDPARFSEVE